MPKIVVRLLKKQHEYNRYPIPIRKKQITIQAGAEVVLEHYVEIEYCKAVDQHPGRKFTFNLTPINWPNSIVGMVTEITGSNAVVWWGWATPNAYGAVVDMWEVPTQILRDINDLTNL